MAMPRWKKTNQGIEYAVINKARGLKRGERGQSWDDPRSSNLVEYEEGDYVCIDPFTDSDGNSRSLWPVYCEFVRYVTDEIAEVKIGPESEESSHTWFKYPAGNYLIHEGYITPQ